MFQFSCRLVFSINFSSFKPDTKNNANFDAVSEKHANFDEEHFLMKHIPKLTIFGRHNLQTFKHNTLINKLLHMQLSYLIFVLNCFAGSDENYASYCSELSQLHQQPVDAVLRPTFVWKFCYKLPTTFTFIQIFDQNFVFFAE